MNDTTQTTNSRGGFFKKYFLLVLIPFLILVVLASLLIYSYLTETEITQIPIKIYYQLTGQRLSEDREEFGDDNTRTSKNQPNTYMPFTFEKVEDESVRVVNLASNDKGIFEFEWNDSMDYVCFNKETLNKLGIDPKKILYDFEMAQVKATGSEAYNYLYSISKAGDYGRVYTDSEGNIKTVLLIGDCSKAGK